MRSRCSRVPLRSALFVTWTAYAAALKLSDAPLEDVTVWSSIPDTDVTFSYTFTAKEGAYAENIVESIKALQFCFSDLLIILDVPHGGFLRSQKEAPGGPEDENSEYSLVPQISTTPFAWMGGGVPDDPAERIKREMKGVTEEHWHKDDRVQQEKRRRYLEDKREFRDRVVSQLSSKAAQAAELLNKQCGREPKWQVKVMDYRSPELCEAVVANYVLTDMGKHYCQVGEGVRLFNQMYVNTMVYDMLFGANQTAKYIFHSDADRRTYPSPLRQLARPGFVDTAVSLMRSDSRVVVASPVVTAKYSMADFNHDKPQEFVPGSVTGKPSGRRKGLLEGFIMDMRNKLWGAPFDANWSSVPGEKPELFNVCIGASATECAVKSKVSTEQFLMDVSRFREMLPFENWDLTPEVMWAKNFQAKRPEGAFFIWIGEECGVFAGPPPPAAQTAPNPA